MLKVIIIFRFLFDFISFVGIELFGKTTGKRRKDAENEELGQVYLSPTPFVYQPKKK